MLFYGKLMLGTPYVGHTLEGDKEYMTIDIDEVDCTTFVETLMALSKATLNKRINWRDYANNLENLRYRKGAINGYPSRLHYICDWAVDNISRGNVMDVTATFPTFEYLVKTIDFMSTHRDLYPALKDSVNLEKIKSLEMGYRLHKFPYIKKRFLGSKDVKRMFRNGDIVALVTKENGIDVSHMGIIIVQGDNPYLIHASSIQKKVIIDPNPLAEMLRISKDNIGVRIFRLLDN